MVQVKIEGHQKEVEEGTKLLELAREFGNTKGQIVLAKVNRNLRELNHEIRENCTVEFVTTKKHAGMTTYRRSVTLLMLKAVHDVVGEEHIKKISVMYSLSKGYYCELESSTVKVDQKLLNEIKTRMLELVRLDLPIQKISVSTEEASEKFGLYGMSDKEKLFQYRMGSRTNLYRIEHYEDYFYGYMVPSTGFLKVFDLFLYDEGFVLQMPVTSDPEAVPPFEPQQKLFNVLKESREWSITMGLDTIGTLNDAISKGDINNLILIQEALQEKKLAQLADEIIKNNKKIVLIAGPSSSGKTTFSHRLSIQLRIHGRKPHPISVDDYFLDRECSPKDENGEYNFEALEAIDVKQFNEDISKLLAGKSVQMPKYNFVTGKREYKNSVQTLGENDILVIEGIHGLNKKLTYDLPRESMYKIYISALTQVNIDEHNRMPTTDGRLIRRIVRDARHRGTSAKETIARWGSVRKGEEQNIFPFQEEADAMFNSALIYELPVLKQFAQPLLFAIPRDAPEYIEAKRLLKCLDYVLGISSESVPKNSLLREFIGNSCFDV